MWLARSKSLNILSEDTLSVINDELNKEDSEDRIEQVSFWITLYDHNERLLREVLRYWDAFDPSTDRNFVVDFLPTRRRGIPGHSSPSAHVTKRALVHGSTQQQPES